MVKTSLFDFDGVLVDSYAITVKYFQETFRNFHLAVPDERKFISLFGLKTIDILKKLQPQLTDEEVNEIFKINQALSLQYVPKIPLMPHVSEILKLLHKKYKLGIVSSRGKESMHLLLKKYALEHFFYTVIDREDVKKHKPDPEGILRAMKLISGKKEETIYIGDTNVDILAAKGAGIKSIIVGKENSHGAEYHIKNLRELPTLLQSL